MVTPGAKAGAGRIFVTARFSLTQARAPKYLRQNYDKKLTKDYGSLKRLCKVQCNFFTHGIGRDEERGDEGRRIGYPGVTHVEGRQNKAGRGPDGNVGNVIFGVFVK